MPQCASGSALPLVLIHQPVAPGIKTSYFCLLAGQRNVSTPPEYWPMAWKSLPWPLIELLPQPVHNLFNRFLRYICPVSLSMFSQNSQPAWDPVRHLQQEEQQQVRWIQEHFRIPGMASRQPSLSQTPPPYHITIKFDFKG